MKFAYLILAHNSFELLKELVKALDSPDNDIYIHIDLKAGNIDLSPFLEVVKYSKLHFIQDRVNVKWGRISVVEAELNLFTEAIKGDYDYLHLLSGVDFPIKSNTYIQQFFQTHKGKEFVGFSNVFSHEDIKKRTIWQPFLRKEYHGFYKFINILNKLAVYIQDKLHLYSINPTDSIKVGSEWCSITKQLAVNLVNQKESILRRYKHVFAADETFIQTYIYENNLMDRVYNLNDEFESCCRDIDWKRGFPYIWQDQDFEELVNSKYLWARKFSEKNINLIKSITNHIEKKS